MRMPWHNQTNLAKLAAIFAVVLGIAFGLCSVSALTIAGNQSTLGRIAPYFIGGTVIIEAACIIGLLVIAFITVTRAIKSRFTNN